MEKSKVIIGLDIGTTKIAAIAGFRNEYGKIEIIGVGKTESIGVSRGVVTNIDKTVYSIKTAIEECEKLTNETISEVIVGIAGQHIRSIQQRGNIMRNNPDDEISPKDIKELCDSMYKLVVQPGEEIIHVIPQEFVIDKEPGIKDPVGMAGSCLEADFHIITGQVTAAKNIQRCVVDRSNLDINALILEPIASAEAVLHEDEKEAGVALVDIGGGTTDIAIFKNGIIRHTAVIPFGGNVITNDIIEGCSIVKSTAEALKIKFGSALPNLNKDNEIISIPGLRGRPSKEISVKTLSSIIEARMVEILDLVIQEIKYSGYANKLSAGIVLTGGGAMLKHLIQLTEFKTGMDTKIGYPNEHLANSDANEYASPILATGVGLVIKGIELYESQPVKQVTKSQPKEKGKIFSKISDSFFTLFNSDEIK